MDRYGKGEEIILKNAINVAGRKPSFMNFDRELFTGCSDFTELDLVHHPFNTNMILFFPNFSGMCILAGCDFLPSVPGIGIVKAYNLVAKYRNLDRVRKISLEQLMISKPYQVLFKNQSSDPNHIQL